MSALAFELPDALEATAPPEARGVERDAVKLLVKEIVIPAKATTKLFVLGPIMTIMPALAAWAVVPFGPDAALANVNAGLLLLLFASVAVPSSVKRFRISPIVRTRSATSRSLFAT